MLCRCKYYDPWAEIGNLESVEKFPEYKYSAYKLFRGVDLLKYLRRYEQYPAARNAYETRL